MTFKIVQMARYEHYCVFIKVTLGFKNVISDMLEVTSDLDTVIYEINHVTRAIRDQPRTMPCPTKRRRDSATRGAERGGRQFPFAARPSSLAGCKSRMPRKG